MPSPVGEGGPSETVDEASLARMIFLFCSFAVAERKFHHFRAFKHHASVANAPTNENCETALGCPLKEGDPSILVGAIHESPVFYCGIHLFLGSPRTQNLIFTVGAIHESPAFRCGNRSFLGLPMAPTPTGFEKTANFVRSREVFAFL